MSPAPPAGADAGGAAAGGPRRRHSGKLSTRVSVADADARVCTASIPDG